MQFNADLESLTKMMLYISEQTKLDDLPSKTKNHIELAIEEALVNIINYAYSSEKVGRLDIQCLRDDKKIKFILKDWGKPFDPTKESKKPNFDLSIEERPIGGLGIHLLRSLMDDVHYRREDDANILELRKNL
ncbi:MAG: ATP-binding protein [Parachlamydiales bacterium]|nr:ATP-binding protein [Parachlamydiales bacterium]